MTAAFVLNRPTDAKAYIRMESVVILRLCCSPLSTYMSGCIIYSNMLEIHTIWAHAAEIKGSASMPDEGHMGCVMLCGVGRGVEEMTTS